MIDAVSLEARISYLFRDIIRHEQDVLFFSAIAIYFLGVLLVDSRLTSAIGHCCAPATIYLGIYQSHEVSSALSLSLPVPKVLVYPRKG